MATKKTTSEKIKDFQDKVSNENKEASKIDFNKTNIVEFWWKKVA